MDDNQLNAYIAKLPKPVQDVFFDNTWQERTVEIAKKYSLTDSQIDDLTDIVSLTIIGIQKPDDVLETVIGDLGISKLLAEQIIEDLENRVFGYALKLIENKEKPKSTPIQVTSTSYRPTSKIPEVKPENLPMIEKGEGVKVNPPPKPAPAPVISNSVPKSNQEFTQKPYGVPRFGMASVPPKVQVIDMTKNVPKTPQNAMDSKMNFVTTSIPKDMQKKPAPASETPPSMPGTKYGTDPYREPLN